jgi:carbamate kinase
VAPDGPHWRRVVASPKPMEILEAPEIALLSGHGAVLICTGGGGIPVTRDSAGALKGIEAVIDKDLASALLAGTLGADKLLLLTDVDAVYAGYGTPETHAIRRTTPERLRQQDFASGSMGPKVEAAAGFVEATGNSAAIGKLEDAVALLRGDAGTQIETKA